MTWLTRNQRTWNLDLGILTGAGIELAAPPDAATRLGLADAGPSNASAQGKVSQGTFKKVSTVRWNLNRYERL